MNPTHFLIALLAVVSVAGSLAFTALLTRPDSVPMAPSAPGAAPQSAVPDRATILARVETLRDRLTADPDDGEGWKMLGRSLFVLGRYSESVMAYSRAAQLLPSDPDIRGALLQLEEKARERNAHEKTEGKPGE